MRVCPYNRDYTKLSNRLMQRLMGSPLRGLALWLDGKRRHGERVAPKDWWRLSFKKP